MEKLIENKTLEFEMNYHVESGRFEKVNILNFQSREVIDQASFQTVAAPAPAV